MGGGGGYSAGQRGSGHSAAPGRRYGLTRGEPRRAAPPPPLNFRGDCTTPGVGGGGGGGGCGPRAAHGHGHMDTGARTHGHGHTDTGLHAALGALQGAQLRCGTAPAGLHAGPGRGGGEGAQQRSHPRRPPPGPLGGLRAGVAVPVPAPGPSPEPRGRGHLSPRSRRGAGLTWRGARLRAAAGPAARPPCSPPAAAWDLRGGGGGVGAQASGPGGAERSGRPAALLPPTPTPRSVPVRRCVASLLGPRVSVYIVRPLRHRTARPRRSRRPSAPRAPRRAFNGPGRARGTPPALKGPRRSRGGKTQRERDARGDR